MQLETTSNAEKFLGSDLPEVRNIPHSISLVKEEFGSLNPC